jgi:hypothetical protein
MNVLVVVNWLINLVQKIMDKVNEHSKIIKFTQKVADDKADQEEFDHLEADLGWETLETRANFLGLSQFQKFQLKLTCPLVLSLMPNNNLNCKTRNKDFYCQFPKKSHKFSTSFFPHFTKLFTNLSTDLQVENLF